MEEVPLDPNPKLHTMRPGRHILVAVDASESAARTVAQALRENTPGKDKITLMHIYSGWDYLNDEKNDGRLALDLQSSVVEKSGFECHVVQREASESPQADFVAEAELRNIDILYIGEGSFINVANPDNYVYRFFSAVKRAFVGTMAEYIKSTAKCTVVVVMDPISANLEVPPVEPPPQPPRDFNVDKQVVEGLSIEQYDFHSDSDDSDDDIRVAHKATNAGPAV